jgi:hypothetical protein
MCVVGSAHPHKIDAGIVLERLVVAGERLVTDAEVFQEILHRYTAIDRREAIGPAFQAMLDIVDEVIPIEKTDVLRSGEITQHRIQTRECGTYRGYGAPRHSIDLEFRCGFRPLAGFTPDSPRLS